MKITADNRRSIPTMKTTVLLALAAFLAFPSQGDDVAEEVKAAAQRLAEQPNYSWTTRTESPQLQAGRPAGRVGVGLPNGRTEKDGFTVLAYQVGDHTQEVVVKAGKVSIKSGDEWLTADELKENRDGSQGTRAGRAQLLVRRAQQFKKPATAARELIDRVKALTKDGDVYSGELTTEGIKQLLAVRGRLGAGAGVGPDLSRLKGSARFWVKDGVLAKFEQHIEGKMSGVRNSREVELNRTTTVAITDVGSTKVFVAAEAKKKLLSN